MFAQRKPLYASDAKSAFQEKTLAPDRVIWSSRRIICNILLIEQPRLFTTPLQNPRFLREGLLAFNLSMATPDLLSLPTPQHLTLLFKHGKSSTVLSVLPSQSLTEVKATLLEVLQSRDITHFPGTSEALPSQPTDLELGILADRRDPGKGFVFAEDRSTLTQSTTSAKKKSTAKKEGPIETFADLDLKDGAWVAYRLKADALDLVDEEAEDMDVEPGVNADPGWNVIIPSYEDEEQDGAAGQVDDDMDIPIPKPRNAVAR